MTKQFFISLSFMMGIFLLSADAWAYLDPGTGSMLLQGILGGIAAISVVLKLYWHQILILLGLRKAKPEEDEPVIESSSVDKPNVK
jgi:hypothetical protein